MRTLRRIGLVGIIASLLGGALPVKAEEANVLNQSRQVVERADGSKYVRGALEVVFKLEAFADYLSQSSLIEANPVLSASQFSPAVASILGSGTQLKLNYLNLKNPAENVWTVVLPSQNVDLEKIAASLYKSNQVKVAKPLGIADPAYTPNDPVMPWGISDYRIDKAWDVTKGRPDVKIGIADTGVATSHPDIAPNLVGCDSVVATATNPLCEDTQGHGTYVSGVAIAKGDNNTCIPGICYDCGLTSVKVDDDGGGWLSTNLAAGMLRARDLGARVINVSWAGSSPTVQSTTATLYTGGIVVVAAAGNSNTSSPCDPASLYEALGVGGLILPGDVRWGMSNWGQCVDIMADAGPDSTSGNNGCGAGSGTSLSSPAVAGAAGLVISHWLDQGLCSYTVDDVFAALLTTATPLPVGNPDPTYYGVGKLNGDPANGFLSVSPSCQTVSSGGVLDKSGVVVPSLDVCYNDTLTIKGEGFLADDRVYPDPSCLMQFRLMSGAGLTEVAPWGVVKSWSFGPVVSAESLVVQSKRGNEGSSCWYGAGPVLLSLVPSNVVSTSLGPVGQDKCPGQALDLVVSDTQVSAACLSCDLSNVVYAVFDNGNPVTGYSNPGFGSPPSYSPVAIGAHTIQVGAKCSGEPGNRVKLSNQVMATVASDVQAQRVVNVKFVKTSGSNLDVSFDNQVGITSYQLEGSVSKDPAGYVPIKDVVGDVGLKTTDSVSGTGLPPGLMVYMGVVGKSSCTGIIGPE
ncbi:MAG: S8 family serine peptidase [Nanoarchaeota archaeon]